MGRLGQGAKALAASMRQKEVAEDKLKQQAKKDAKDRAKAARRRTKDLVDEGAGLYYDKIQEVDPDVVNGRVSPVERPQMKPLFSGTDDDEPGEDKDEQGEDRGQSTQCSNLLPSAYSAAEELDPNPPRGGNGSNGKWHEDADGVPFSSKMLCSVVKSVWKEPSLAITAYQLVWTCLVVEAHLRGQNLDMNDTINANNMEAMAKVVAARFTAARKAKQVTKVTVKDIDKSVTVMELIPTYIELGSDGLRGGRKEKKQKTKGKARVTEQAAWDTILGGEEQPEEVADE